MSGPSIVHAARHAPAPRCEPHGGHGVAHAARPNHAARANGAAERVRGRKRSRTAPLLRGGFGR
ncbi:hypothetical protein [uncultured Methylobacterium sp.]|uniref:hypothetical protein n=1 Tax=uncultured Methylobacterium sp. TaxID=157278 RepID=UPI0035CB044E